MCDNEGMKKGATTPTAARFYPLAIEILRNFGALREALGI